ncbi:MAG: SCO6880 family protein [Dermatophilaceae bacterium]
MAVGSAQVASSRTYGNWRKPTSSGLFGLGSIGTAIMLGGIILAVLVTMASNLLRGLITFGLLVVVLGTIVIRDRHGKSLLDRGLARIAWAETTRKGAHLYRSGPLGFAPWGTHQLPGIAAQLRLSEHTDSYGRAFALIYAPSTRTYTAVLVTEPDGASLVDPEQVDSWVAEWGHWLSNLADEPGIQGCAVTVETAPDTGNRLRQEVTSSLDPNAPAFARDMLAEVVELYPAGSSVIKAYVTLTFAAVSAATGKTRTDAEMGRDLGARLPGLTGSLSSTGAGAARAVDAGELCEVIRSAYNPGVAPLLEQAHAASADTGLDWSDVGPAAAEADWEGYRHDDAHSVTWSMTTAPRGSVQSSVLARLLAPHREVARKRVTLLYRPIDAGKAAAIVESDLRSAQFVATSTNRPSARAVLATRSAASTASEEASGAGLVNFGMLVTATVLDADRLPVAKATIDNLAATARLRLRPVYGAQASAFAAALPLGLILPKHLKVPAAMKDRL